jgi:DNA-binding MarR family transcriptional regulator
METESETTRDLILLEKIEQNPDATQASLATQLDVAVGTINWHLKRLINKGYVKAGRVQRRKLRYIITPEGVTLRARLTLNYIQTSFTLYRNIRQRVIELLEQAHHAGYDRLRLLGDGDVADVCRLTCIEQGFSVVMDEHLPALVVSGVKVNLHLEGYAESGSQ